MFRCQQCHHEEFRLMVDPSFQGNVEVQTNEHDEVVIRANDREFVADLMFMNQFAICDHCEGIHQWEYYFPKNTHSPTRKP